MLDTTSTLPNYRGLPAQIEIRRVQPVYDTERCRDRVSAAILVHGRTVDGISAFDVRYQDYSLMRGMANSGIEAFAFNQLGFGGSSHFGMDDPCNASLSTDRPVNVNPANQQNLLLVPNPLDSECAHSDTSYFTDRQAGIDQLSTVVEHVLRVARRRSDRDRSGRKDGRSRVSLFSWSLGSTIVGPYLASRGHQAKIDRLVMLSGPFGTTPALSEFEPTSSADQPSWPLGVGNFASVSALVQVNPTCTGQRDAGVLNAVWRSMRQRDRLASEWGSTDPVTGGLSRWPTAVRWGWNQTQASRISIPVLVIGGMIDQTVPPAHLDALYDALASSQKVRLRIECASHAGLWEGSSEPGWRGPHDSIQAAVVEWLTAGTFRGQRTGRFHTLTDGTTELE